MHDILDQNRARHKAMASQTNGLNGHNGQNVQKLLQNLEGINAESFGNDGN